VLLPAAVARPVDDAYSSCYLALNTPLTIYVILACDIDATLFTLLYKHSDDGTYRKPRVW